MTKESQLRDAIDLVWRNMPNRATTFSPCDCGRGAGRGGGPCIECAKDRIAALVGSSLADNYVTAVGSVRRLEEFMNSQLK